MLMGRHCAELGVKSGGGRLPVASSISARRINSMSSRVRASCAARSSGVRRMIFFLFFFPLIVFSLNVSKDLLDDDLDVGQLPHHGRHLATVDPLLLVHPARVPAHAEPRKASFEAS